MTTARDAILHLAAQHGPETSFSPNQAAQLIDPDNWRHHLTETRNAALRLAAEGRIDILRKGKPVALADGIRGVIRLRALPGAVGPS
jgi:hypothetical protein